MSPLTKYFYHRWTNGEKWHPLLAFYYLTNACDFHCPYCHTGPFRLTDCHTAPAILPGPEVIQLLKIIRQYTDSIVITGGEPLNHPDFAYVLDHLREVPFKRVFLASNGYQLDRYLTSIVNTVDFLVISLDTLNEKKADSFAGAGPGTFKKVLANLEQVARYPNKRYQITISSVVTPNNIDDLYEVYRYTQERHLVFAAAPQLVGVHAVKSLVNNPRYRQFYDFLIAEKRKGGEIFGPPLYLEYLRDLKEFRCYPFTMLAISPVGEVFYPCLEIGRQIAGNLLQQPDLHQIRQQGLTQFGPPPACGDRCHSACVLGFSLAMRYPSYLFQEAYFQSRNWLCGFWKRKD